MKVKHFDCITKFTLTALGGFIHCISGTFFIARVTNFLLTEIRNGAEVMSCLTMTNVISLAA